MTLDSKDRRLLSKLICEPGEIWRDEPINDCVSNVVRFAKIPEEFIPRSNTEVPDNTSFPIKEPMTDNNSPPIDIPPTEDLLIPETIISPDLAEVASDMNTGIV
tara:strand:- start:277 stop:588 length:312 start_codon:yes stop_codon:yes gene_type:complete